MDISRGGGPVKQVVDFRGHWEFKIIFPVILEVGTLVDPLRLKRSMEDGLSGEVYWDQQDCDCGNHC